MPRAVSRTDYYSGESTETITKRIRRSKWEHVDFLDSHPVDVFLDPGDHPRCRVCRQRVRPVVS